jgi:hypothetical protein
VLGAGLGVLVAGCGGGSHPKATVVGRDSAAGSHAAAEASITVPTTEGLSVRVGARPRQRVTGSWAISCHAAAIGSSRDADDFGGTAPLTVPLRSADFGGGAVMPCTVVVDARLAKARRLEVEILKR